MQRRWIGLFIQGRRRCHEGVCGVCADEKRWTDDARGDDDGDASGGGERKSRERLTPWAGGCGGTKGKDDKE